ncbi:MAG TPA: ELWxxDGT repeat protein [Parafilimonas sp.]|nr:ELWxxDGT repeat protein [Parafilimonas sp.]
MLKDINDSKDANPFNSFLSNKGYGWSEQYAVLNYITYFSTPAGLWRSDGTTNGTYLLKNLHLGEITVMGNLIYFTADDGIHGLELWRSDGTAGGTTIVKDIYNGITGSSPQYLISVNGTLYFVATTKDKGMELMKSDGTEAGTILVKDITTGSGSSRIFNITNVQGTLFFFCSSPVDSLRGLWKTSGTEASTQQLAYFNDYTSPHVGQYLAAGNKFFFTLNQSSSELWASDGTVAGTIMVKDIKPSGGSLPQDFASMNNILYFTANDAGTGSELWRSDGTSTGTYMLKDINPISGAGSNPNSKVVVNGQMFFLATNQSGNEDLWTTDGTKKGTVLVKSFGTENLSKPLNLTGINNTLYFAGYTSASGYELWKSDGTTEGTVLIKDIFPGIYSSSPAYLTGLGSKCIFSATDEITGRELWISDGTSKGTFLVKDINQTVTSSSNTFFSPTVFKNKMYFRAYTPKYGDELWVTDGTESNTKRVTDIEPGSLSGLSSNRLYNYFTSPTKIYFEANALKYGNELWSSDGVSSNLVADITSGRTGTNFLFNFYGNQNHYCNIDTTTYFVGNYNSNLFKTTGTAASTVLLKNAYSINALVMADNKVFFTTQSNGNYTDLWQTDGTADGTIQITAAVLKATGFFERPSILAFKDIIYFQSSANTLWRTNGSTYGTTLFKNINPMFVDTHYATDSLYATINGNLLFVADDGASGKELWKTDGTPQGTVLLKDIFTGPGSSLDGYPNGFFTTVNNEVYFLANDNVHGTELWKTDGTVAGTIIVKDITPGSASSTITDLIKVDNNLVFLFYDYDKAKHVLWQSDGTNVGTHAVNDPSLDNVEIHHNVFEGASTLATLNNQIYFTGYTPQYGYELWVGSIDILLPVQLLDFTGKLINKDGQLNWSVINEQNFGYFNVQRSTDGIHFTTIGRIIPKVNTSSKTDYQYLDKNIYELGYDKIYYRLEEVDKDGEATLSKIVLIKLDNSINVSLRPNPASSSFALSINNSLQATQSITISVSNSQGRLMLTEKRQSMPGSQKFIYNCSTWAPGVYFLKVVLPVGVVREIKVIKQ